MKLWVVLVAATLLAGCGAEPDPPQPTTPTPRKIWGYLGVLGEAAENATAWPRRFPLVQKLQSLVTELEQQTSTLRATLAAEAAEAWGRVAEYGAEARTALESGWGELKNRGAAYARKLRKRLNRDGDELRRRWDAYGQSVGERAAALRRSWGARGGVWGDPQVTQSLED